MIKYCVASLAVGLALGYFAMPKKEVIKVQEKYVDRVVTIIKRPDGTEEKVIVDKSKIVNNETVKTNIARPRVGLSALVGTDFNVPVYGIAVNKEFIGPITLGAWGLTNKTVGLSIGLNF